MQLYDSGSDKLVEFVPDGVVTIYTCGITPYDSTHIGHAAVFLTFDILQRRLRSLGHETRLVRNVTDIDDDILRKAKEIGIDYRELVNSETHKLNEDLKALNVLESWSEPLATSAIAEIVEFSSKAIESGHGYEVDGTVFFDTSKWEEFGSLSGYSEKEMLALAAERGGFPDDERKRNPLDFILWQAAKPGEPTWESPWGPGRPGWHIECSVLAQRELGNTIDIHGGGADLLFPHHECELAQTKAVTGNDFVNIWMHQAMVRMDGEKMSKSLGNMDFVGELRESYDPRAIRLASSRNHYRQEWDWDRTLLEQSVADIKLWEQASNPDKEDELYDVVGAHLDNDLDMPAAVAAIVAQAEQGYSVSKAADLIGIALTQPNPQNG